MGTDVSVVIAYKDLGVPERRASYNYVASRWSGLGAEIVVVDDVEPFGRAAAINEGVRRASGDLIIQSDPDSFVPYAQAYAALWLASQADGLVVAFDRALYFNAYATQSILYGAPAAQFATPGWCDVVVPMGLGNVVAFSRATWREAGGFDERFGMWGGDDAAFAYATEAFVGPVRRVTGDMFHLWHPRLPESEPGHPGYLAQMSILGQYRDAAAVGPEAVRELVGSR